jgi:hypothetical protein
MLIEFDIEKTTLGRIPVGGLFTYNNKLWKVVNKIDGESKSLVANVGNGCRDSFSLAFLEKVCYIIEARNIQEGTYESS